MKDSLGREWLKLQLTTGPALIRLDQVTCVRRHERHAELHLESGDNFLISLDTHQDVVEALISGTVPA